MIGGIICSCRFRIARLVGWLGLLLVWVSDLLEVGFLGSSCLTWVFLGLRFFCLDWLCCIFGLIWYFGTLGFDDFAGFEKIVVLRFMVLFLVEFFGFFCVFVS